MTHRRVPYNARIKIEDKDIFQNILVRGQIRVSVTRAAHNQIQSLTKLVAA